MGQPIDTLTIEGFKSIRKLEDFELRPLNVFIGANGAGKTNLISFFNLLRAIANQKLQGYVLEQGGAMPLYHMGPRHTAEILAKIVFSKCSYRFKLTSTVRDEVFLGLEFVQSGPTPNEVDLAEESVQLGLTLEEQGGSTISHGVKESVLRERAPRTSAMGGPTISTQVLDAIQGQTAYHFHDTTAQAGVRGARTVRDDDYLRSDASNLAPFLYMLSKSNQPAYELIRDTIRLAAPFFEDFRLKPRKSGSDEVVLLEWKQRGSDYPFHPTQLSDGTLRFICLATALLQPNPPSTLIFDEPELGLHPHALSVLAGLFRRISSQSQVIICTQSATLLDYFEPEDVVVVDRKNGESVFQRLKSEDLKEWIDQYSLGDLWWKNVIGEVAGHG